MDKSAIFKMLAYRGMEEIYADIENGLKENKSYHEANEKLNGHLSKFDKGTMFEISNVVTIMETEGKDAAYNQGFSDAVKLLFACMK